MREIKFRAWSEEQLKFIPLETIFFTTDSKILIGKLPDTPRVVLQQFTGLTDKSGKEIYEGDIVVKYPSKSRGNRKVQSYDGVVFEIIYQKEWACFLADAGKLSWLFELAQNEKWDGDNEKFLTCDCEVIGNIYENPELLR